MKFKKKMFIKPNPLKEVEGVPVKVYDPASRDFMPASGREVYLDQYWDRRLRDKDVIEVKE